MQFWLFISTPSPFPSTYSSILRQSVISPFILDNFHRACHLVGKKMAQFRKRLLLALATIIVTVAMLQLVTVNGVFGRLGRRRRPSLPDHLEMPQPAKWMELLHSTWTCTDESEELAVDSALAALDDHDSRSSSGSKARERLEAEKKSIQRRKQCVVKNMCVDGKGTACADQSFPGGTNVAKRGGGNRKKDNGLSFSVMKHFFFFFIL